LIKKEVDLHDEDQHHDEDPLPGSTVVGYLGRYV